MAGRGARDNQQMLELLRRIADATEQEVEQTTGTAPGNPNARAPDGSNALEALSRPVRVGGLASQALGQAGLAGIRAGYARGGALGIAVGEAAAGARRVAGVINRDAFDALTTQNEFFQNIIAAVTPKFVQDKTGLTAQIDIEQGTKRDVLSAVTGAFNVGVELSEGEVKDIARFARERSEGLRRAKEQAVDWMDDTTGAMAREARERDAQKKSQFFTPSNDRQIELLEQIRDELRRPGGLSDQKYGEGKSK